MNTVLLALLNTLWQSAAIAGAVWLLLKFARGTNAATRHAVWWATLAVVVLLPIIPQRETAASVVPGADAAFEMQGAPPIAPLAGPPHSSPAPLFRDGI